MPHNAFYLSDLPNGWTVGRFAALEQMDGLTHAVTTKRGLDVNTVLSDHDAAAAAAAGAMGLGAVAWAQQVHGDTVRHVDTGGSAGCADALLTRQTGLGLMVRGADCVLILAADPVSGAIGAAHASWRGTAAGVASKLVLHMVASLGADASHTIACICPSAGPCCYEVGPEVVQAIKAQYGGMSESFIRKVRASVHLDLWAANAGDLARAGIRPANIHVAGVCTICRHDLFPSFRAEGERAGRFAAVIARTGPAPAGDGE